MPGLRPCSAQAQASVGEVIHWVIHSLPQIQMSARSTGLVEVKMKISYRVAMAQELLRLLAEAQTAHDADCRRLQALVARQVAELLA